MAEAPRVTGVKRFHRTLNKIENEAFDAIPSIFTFFSPVFIFTHTITSDTCQMLSVFCVCVCNLLILVWSWWGNRREGDHWGT